MFQGHIYVAGSNPATPTKFHHGAMAGGFIRCICDQFHVNLPNTEIFRRLNLWG